MWGNMAFNYFHELTHLLVQEWFHFVYSGLAGLVGFLLIQIISYGALAIFRTGASVTTAQKYFILGLGLVCTFFLAWYVHTWLDTAACYLITPMINFHECAR